MKQMRPRIQSNLSNRIAKICGSHADAHAASPPDFMNEHANIKTVDSNLLYSYVLFSFFKHLIRFAYKNTHTAPREDRGTYFNLFLTV